MDFDKIRKMNDEELSEFLKQLSVRNSKFCKKCNKPADFYVKIENAKTYQTRKLCGLCEDCYKDMLDYLQLYDIEWDV